MSSSFSVAIDTSRSLIPNYFIQLSDVGNTILLKVFSIVLNYKLLCFNYFESAKHYLIGYFVAFNNIRLNCLMLVVITKKSKRESVIYIREKERER